MPSPELKARILASLTPECREVYLRLEQAAEDQIALSLESEEAAYLQRLFLHVIAMNIRIEEFMDTDA